MNEQQLSEPATDVMPRRVSVVLDDHDDDGRASVHAHVYAAVYAGLALEIDLDGPDHLKEFAWARKLAQTSADMAHRSYQPPVDPT